MANFTPQEIEQFLQEFFDVVGTRQYVGARYVPLFGRRGEDDITWDDSAPYEPLTIVIHAGDSYTSRTYVPAGIDITNETYWAKTGSYNAQVEAYRREVVQLETDWAEWKDDTEDDITAWKAETLTEFTQAKHGCAIYIGNSYTMGTGGDGHGIYEFTKDYFYKTYTRLIGGTGFGTYADHPQSFADMLTYAVNQLSETEKSEITHVLFISAVGDCRIYDQQGSTMIDTTMGECSTIIKQNLPNAIGYVYSASAFRYSNTDGVTNKNCTLVHKLFLDRCRVNGLVYLGWGGFNICKEQYAISSDDYHPNENGYKRLSTDLLAALFGGGIPYKTVQTDAHFTYDDGTTVHHLYAKCQETIDGLWFSSSNANTSERWLDGDVNFECDTHNLAIGRTWCGLNPTLFGSNVMLKTNNADRFSPASLTFDPTTTDKLTLKSGGYAFVAGNYRTFLIGNCLLPMGVE